MGLADLSFLQRLFDVAGSLTDDADNESLAFGLGEIGANSALARDDADMEGFWVSMVVMHGVSAALDHVVTLRSAVGEAETVTVSAPWTLLRGALEPVSIALWVLAGSTRDRRRERALRVWMHDYEERRKWEQDAGQPQAVAPAKRGAFSPIGPQGGPDLGPAQLRRHCGRSGGRGWLGPDTSQGSLARGGRVRSRTHVAAPTSDQSRRRGVHPRRLCIAPHARREPACRAGAPYRGYFRRRSGSVREVVRRRPRLVGEAVRHVRESCRLSDPSR